MDPLFRLILSVVWFGGKSDSDKVNTPTYSMRNQAEDIFVSFHLIDKEAKSIWQYWEISNSTLSSVEMLFIWKF